MTRADFQKQLDEKFPNEFELVGQYINNRTKVDVKHLHCGKVSPVNPSSLLSGKQKKCSYCYQIERLKNRIEDYLKENNLEKVFTYDIGNAIYQYEKINFHCYVCNNDFKKVIDTFKQGQHCPYCSGQRTNKNSAQHKIDTLTSVGEFALLNDVDAHDSPVNILHNTCGRITDTTLTYFVVQFPECRHCTKEKNREIKMKKHGDFVKEVEELYGNSFEVISEYNGATERVDLIHTRCGNIISPKANHILTNNFGCKYCNMSSPESIIDSVLKEHNLNYDIQVRFDDCISDKNIKLPFDFVIYDKNNVVKYIVEYDGEHHDSEEPFGLESHIRTVKNDSIKNNYCENKSYTLYRIPHTQKKNIKKLVEDFIPTNQ